jgi:pimeloyl-ACP methyl ester carboxylesterase
MIRRLTKSLMVCGLMFLDVGGAVEAKLPGLAMDVSGHGPVVIFESGLGQGQANWKAVVGPLEACLTTVTYDRLEVGRSPERENRDAPVLAAAVAQRSALHGRNLHPPYLLVGHSLGGLFIQAFARSYPDDVAGIVLVDAANPLEPQGTFVSTVPPATGTVEAAEEQGVAPSVAALLSGPPLPPVPLVVLVAADHHDTPQREALWQGVQRRTAALSPKAGSRSCRPVIQTDRPDVVTAAVLQVAREAGADISACHHR